MRVAYCMHEGISYAIVVDCAKPENKCQEKVKRNFSKYSIVWVLLESARKTKLRTYVRRLDEIGTAFDSAKTQGQSGFNYYYSFSAQKCLCCFGRRRFVNEWKTLCGLTFDSKLTSSAARLVSCKS